MDILALAWALYGRAVIEVFTFAGFEIIAYWMLIRILEKHRISGRARA